MRSKDLYDLMRDTVSGCRDRDTFQLGAALAFYAAFALAPILVIAIALAGIFFGEEAAKGQLDATLTEATGPVMAKAVIDTLADVHMSKSGWIATVFGVGFVLFAATGLVIQLQTALNVIWEVQPKPGQSVWNMMRSRFFAFMLIVGIGALLVLSLIANTALATLRARAPETFGMGQFVLWESVDWLLSILLQTLLFAMIFKLLPDAKIAWRDVWIGALITAVLFALGNFLFSHYLRWAAPASVYGPAGSAVVLLLWVYFSSQSLLFGAEFTKHFANKYGNRMRPADYATSR
jgi:membrane protein